MQTLNEAEWGIENPQMTFPMRVAARMTGLSPELLRAWERRYAAVEPLRTEGGTRRYTAENIQRLQLLRRAVDAGLRISDAAQMDSEVLLTRLAPAIADSEAERWIESVMDAVCQLDSERARALLEARAVEIGLAGFVREEALSVLYEIGERWEARRLSIGAEHFASSLLRSILASDLFARPSKEAGPKIVFATPAGEDHDLGLLIAAITAAEAGANIVFLGANLPEADLIESVESSRADVLALGLVALPRERAMGILKGLRQVIPARIPLWVGGAGARKCSPLRGVEHISNLGQLVAHVALLDVEKSADASAGPELWDRMR